VGDSRIGTPRPVGEGRGNRREQRVKVSLGGHPLT